MTSMPCSMASMVTELMTPLTPGAGPPPTTRPTRPGGMAGLLSEGRLWGRGFYVIPAQGQARKLVHRIEPRALDHLPGAARMYLRWQELEAGVAALTAGARRVAMEYVPRNANPYVSRVDAGTVELVRSCGPEVVPSGDLVQMFEACWDDEQWATHLEAAQHTRSAYDVAF